MAKAQILIVEDDNITVLELRDRLQSLGYTVSAVASYGEEAIAKAGEMRPDLALMDIRLKGAMNGVEAAEEIRARFDIPVVYLTAYADEATLQRAKVTEPYGYIIKPLEERELHSSIEMALYRHEMERKLKESERWLATTLRSIGDAVIATDREGLVTFMNPVAEALMGWKQEEALGRDLAEVFNIINEETRTLTQNPVTRAIREGVVVGLANHSILIAKDGREIPIDDSAAPIRDDRGNVTGVVLVFRDITERKRVEEALQRRTRQQEQLLETARHLTESLDFKEVLTRIGMGAKEILEAHGCAIYLLEPDGRTLTPVVAIEPPYEEEILSTPLDIETSFTGQAVKAGHALVFNDAAANVSGQQIPGTLFEEEERVIVSPFVVDDKVLGAMCLKRTRTLFSKEDLALAETFATYAATALKNAQTHDELQREVKERKRAEEDIRQRALEQETVSRIAYALNTPDVRDASPVLVEGLQDLTGCDLVNLIVMDEAAKQFIISLLESPFPIPGEGDVMPLSATAVLESLRAGRPHLTADLSTETHFPFEQALYQAGLRSRVTLPLLVGGEVFGALNLGGSHTGLFREDQLPVLQQIADALALALQNSFIFQAEQERRHIAETLRQASAVLSSTLELDEVLGLILQQLRQVIPYDTTSVQLLREERLEIVACQGFEEPDKVVGLVFPLDPKFPNHRVVTIKAAFAIEDVIQDYPHFQDEANTYESGRIRSWLGVPLVVKDQVIGMIAVDRAEVRPYTAEEAQLATAFANQAAIALENAQLYEAAQQEITERKRVEAELTYMATHDSLTSLPNRMLFNDRLALALAHAYRSRQELAVMLLDLDHFKEVNDTLGHSVGDRLLQVVGDRLTSLLRRSDTVARMGGDEFMLLLPEITRGEDAANTAQKILEAIRKPLVFDGHELHITTSLGIAIYPKDGEDADTLMKNADIAMYRAKGQGRDNYQRYT